MKLASIVLAIVVAGCAGPAAKQLEIAKPVPIIVPITTPAVPTPKPATPANSLFELGGNAIAMQNGNVLMRLHPDGTLDGLSANGAAGNAKLSVDGTLSWGDQAVVQMTASKLIKLSTNQSLSIHTLRDGNTTRIFAGGIRFELAPDGAVEMELAGDIDRSVRLEGDAAARHTLFIVLVHTTLLMKVERSQRTPAKQT
jgi:hypothetical protein